MWISRMRTRGSRKGGGSPFSTLLNIVTGCATRLVSVSFCVRAECVRGSGTTPIHVRSAGNALLDVQGTSWGGLFHRLVKARDSK